MQTRRQATPRACGVARALKRNRVINAAGAEPVAVADRIAVAVRRDGDRAQRQLMLAGMVESQLPIRLLLPLKAAALKIPAEDQARVSSDVGTLRRRERDGRDRRSGRDRRPPYAPETPTRRAPQDREPL